MSIIRRVDPWLNVFLPIIYMCGEALELSEYSEKKRKDM